MVVIDLQDGFTGQPVEIRVNGKTVYSQLQVTTKKLLGIADSVTIENSSKQDGVSILLNVGKDSRQYRIDLDEKSKGDYVGINIEDGQLQHIVSKHPFGYG
jgi:hypothetical protein